MYSQHWDHPETQFADMSAVVTEWLEKRGSHSDIIKFVSAVHAYSYAASTYHVKDLIMSPAPVGQPLSRGTREKRCRKSPVGTLFYAEKS